MTPWPFKDPSDLGVFCDGRVARRERPVLRVVHDHDGDWQFHSLESQPPDEPPSLLCFSHLLEICPAIGALWNLPTGWTAERASEASEWVSEELPPDTDAEP